jgi:hypothetical protein
MLRKLQRKCETATKAATPMAFRRWLETAAPGDWCLYYVGHLAAESVHIDIDPDTLRSHMRTIHGIAAIRDESWLAYMDGQVTLVQKAENSGPSRHYRYFAIRTAPEPAKRYRRPQRLPERIDVV